MKVYSNLGGQSGVSHYEIEPRQIKVRFRDGSVYLYTDASTGERQVEQMKLLAEAGRGLNSFISRYVRTNYTAKLR